MQTFDKCWYGSAKEFRITMTAGDPLLEGNARLQGWWVWIRKRFPELIKAVGPDISDEAIEGGCSLILRYIGF